MECTKSCMCCKKKVQTATQAFTLQVQGFRFDNRSIGPSRTLQQRYVQAVRYTIHLWCWQPSKDTAG